MKVEPEDKDLKLEKVKTGLLPAVLQEIFGKKIIPLLFRWVAAQENPWKANTQDLIEAIKTIGRLYAGGDYELREGRRSPEFRIVS